MISIIICSRKTTISEELSVNIAETVGCAYELIIIDNSENEYSIFEAYNLGIEKSNGEYLCFIHDDILFHSQNWGMVINEIFESDDKIGLIGVAGAKVKTKMPSAWWDCPEKYHAINIIQHFSNSKYEHWNIGFEKPVEEVVVIDGVFMVIRKNKNIFFNEELKGFHNYDLNISFEVIKKGLRAVVTNQILIEHFSIGTINNFWYKSTIKIHNLYRDLLPLDIKKNNVLKKIEFINGEKFIKGLMKNQCNKQALLLWFRLIAIKPISKFHLVFFNLYFK